MPFVFNSYMQKITRKNPNYGRIIRSSLHNLTEYLRTHGARSNWNQVITLIDRISQKKRLKYADAINYAGGFAVKESLLAGVESLPSRTLIGADPTRAVVGDILLNYPSLIARRGAAGVKQSFAGFLTFDLHNCQAVRTHVTGLWQRLGTNGFKDIFNRYELKETEFNPRQTRDHYQRAALWICGSSMSFDATRLEAVNNGIRHAVLRRTNIRTMQGIQQVYDRIVTASGTVTQPRRPPVLGSPLTSDKAGRALMETAIARIPNNHTYSRDLACYLLGTIIRCHGYIDGNGRIGRAVFVICQMRTSGSFIAISKEGEDLLTGL